MSAPATTASKVRNITCTWCAGSSRQVIDQLDSEPCTACAGYGLVSAHDLAECWCDGTADAPNHSQH